MHIYRVIMANKKRIQMTAIGCIGMYKYISLVGCMSVYKYLYK